MYMYIKHERKIASPFSL